MHEVLSIRHIVQARVQFQLTLFRGPYVLFTGGLSGNDDRQNFWYRGSDWSLKLREENRLKTSDKRVVWKILGLKGWKL